MIELVDEIPDVDGVVESRVEDKVNYGEDLRELEFREKLNRVQRLEHTLTEERSMLTQRQWYAFLLLLMSAAWLWFIGDFVWHFGEVTVAPKSLNSPEVKPVSDPVLIALITTTTLNVLGLFYIVARWLFPQKNGSAEKPSA